MLGIEEIASYIPDKRISNYDQKDKFELNDIFIEEKLGVRKIAIKDDCDNTSDLCVKAFQNLCRKVSIDQNDIRLLIVITQNPDVNIPHTSAILHGKLGFSEDCAGFDISLGCSGYVYGLSIIQSFMNENNIDKGLLFTSDPYSKIINYDDKNTSLLFGDAASVTLISNNPLYRTGVFTFGTIGKNYSDLMCKDGKLSMNGRAVYNFFAKYVPADIQILLQKNSLRIEDIDKFIFHQGSKFIVDNIAKRLKLDTGKVVFDMYDYGNTVSSSIPIILEKELRNRSNNNMVISGFGVGLSWASGILIKV